jgi:hypothetical protein
MTTRLEWFVWFGLTSVIGCNTQTVEVGTGVPDSGVPDSGVPDPGGPTLSTIEDAEVPPLDGAAGAYFTITGSAPLSGAYALNSFGSFCAASGGSHEFGAVGSTGTIDVNYVGGVLDAGQTATSPSVTLKLTFGSVDDGTYPAPGRGTCSIFDESGQWPLGVNIQFACNGLIGIGSGDSFGASGYINCP